MKALFWIFVISFSVNLEMIFAKLHGFPNFLESNTYNGEKSTRLSYRANLVHLAEDCVQELGLRGMHFEILIKSRKTNIHIMNIGESKEVRRSKIVCIIECIGRKIKIVSKKKVIFKFEYEID